MVWQVLVIAIVAYLIGSINPSIILSKLLGKGDIRTQGSGNAGTTNTLRVLGKGPAVLVLLIDVLKAVIAVLLGKWIITWGNTAEAVKIYNDYALMASGIGVILGHNWPIYFGFKGGKGVATSLGVILVIEWRIGLICLVFALTLMLLSRMVSLGSISAAILYPVLVFILPPGTAFNSRWLYLAFAIVLALFVLFRHRSNIKRLLSGTENKLWETKAEKKAKLK